jgi:hypothetical protein
MMVMLLLLLTPLAALAVNNSVTPAHDMIYDATSGQRRPAVQDAPGDTSIGYVVFEMDVETPTGDNQLLGVEFDGTYFYVTGGAGGADPNKVYVIDTAGNVMFTLDQPDSTDYWGWRDLCWDGTYAGPDRIDTLYGSYDTRVHKFGIDFEHNNMNMYGTFQGPYHIINRALAYKADSMWFFSGDAHDSCYKFSKTNHNIQTIPNDYYMYGAAYDTDAFEGGWVWWHSQDSTTTPFHCLIEQMDAISMNFTGLVFNFAPTIITSGIAGGLCFYEGFRGMDVLFALVQGNPVDMIVGIFVRQDMPGITGESNVEDAREFRLLSCVPNPTKGNAFISYKVESAGDVLLQIYDKTGCVVRKLVDGIEAGSGTAYWNGDDTQGRRLSSGVYFVGLETQGHREIEKIVLLK